MRPLDLALFADENIHPNLIGRLRGQGEDVRSVHDDSLAGASDVAILHHAREQSRVVLTHDAISRKPRDQRRQGFAPKEVFKKRPTEGTAETRAKDPDGSLPTNRHDARVWRTN